MRKVCVVEQLAMHRLWSENLFLQAQRETMRNGFAQIPFDPIFMQTSVTILGDGIRRMTDTEIGQELFSEQIIGTDHAGFSTDTGLWRRDSDENKWFFHYASNDPRNSELAAIKGYEAYIERCALIGQIGMDIAIRFGAACDEENARAPDPYQGSIRDAFARGFVVVRILRYLTQEKKATPDANIHLDRSGLTAHILSSHPGMRIITDDGKTHFIEEGAMDTIALFPGMKFGCVSEFKYGAGTLHGVRVPEACNGDRLAIVLFMHPAITPESGAHLKKRIPDLEKYEAGMAHLL